MNKKWLTAGGVVLLVILVGVLVLLGTGKPRDIPVEAYDNGVRALEIADKFLAGTIEAKEAAASIDELNARIPNYVQKNDSIDEFNKDVATSRVQGELSALSYEIASTTFSTGGSIIGVEDARDKLAGTLKK